jgi:photosystem II stability/assembly factor-like uncharacterized protein
MTNSILALILCLSPLYLIACDEGSPSSDRSPPDQGEGGATSESIDGGSAGLQAGESMSSVDEGLIGGSSSANLQDMMVGGDDRLDLGGLVGGTEGLADMAEMMIEGGAESGGEEGGTMIVEERVIRLSHDQIDIPAQQGSVSEVVTFTVSLNTDESVSFEANSTASWLRVSIENAETPSQVSISIDATNLEPALLEDEIIITAEGATAQRVQVRGYVLSNWTGGDGPSHGLVTSILIDHLDADIMYVGTNDGVYKSINGGELWAFSGEGLSHYRVKSLAQDPVNQTLYAGTDGGVYRSTDAGASWSLKDQGAVLNVGGNFGGVVSVYASAEDRVFFGSGSIYKSENAGDLWSVLGELSGSSRTLLELVEENVLLVGTWANGIRRSINGGLNFSRVHENLTPFPAPSVITSFAVHPTNGALYASEHQMGLFGDSNILRSVDQGANWSVLSALSHEEIYDLKLHATDPQVMYAAVDPSRSVQNNSAVIKSINGGVSFVSTSLDMLNHLYALAVTPLTPSSLWAVGDGIWHSVNAGGDWTASADGLNAATITALAVSSTVPQRIYAGGINECLFVSTDQAETWSEIGQRELPCTGAVNHLALHPDQPNTLFVMRRGQLWRSVDEGNTFEEIEALSGLSPFKLIFDPQNAEIMYVACGLNGVYKSIDGGTQWSRLSALPSPMILDLDGSSVLYASLNASGFIARSEDGGAQWSYVGQGLPQVARHLTVHPMNAERVIAYVKPPADPSLPTSSYGVYWTDDGGETWHLPIKPIPAEHEVRVLKYMPSAPYWVLAGTSSGVYVSLDDGQRWSPLSEGLRPNYVRSMAFDLVGGRLFIGAIGGGVSWVLGGFQ